MKLSRNAVFAAAGALLMVNVAIVRAFGVSGEAPVPVQTTSPAAVPGVAASVAGAQPAAAAETAATTRDLLRTTTPPQRDLAELARRFKHSCAEPLGMRVPLYRAEAEGETRSFWVLDEPQRRFFQVGATLRYASEHLLFYVQDGREVSHDSLASSARVFEEKSFPVLRRLFVDVVEQPRITILLVDMPDLGGYFSSSDLFPALANPYSNERPMVYMNLRSGSRPGSDGFNSVLAHEIQHFLHSTVHPQQDSWIDEGASILAMSLSGYDQSSYAQRYLGATETQLNAWSETSGQSGPHYGAGYLMLEYFAQRMGGYESVKGLIASPGSSIATFDTFFDRVTPGMRFDDMFRDFVVANAVNDRGLADGRFGHERFTQRARIQESRAQLPALSNAGIRPYATRYVELTPGSGSSTRGDLEVRFSGAGTARLYGASPRSGSQQWWTYGADDSNVTLTRAFDLTATDHATLRFGAWFDLEKDYDYASVAISTDSGCSWRTLPGRHTTDQSPTGQNLGHGYNGRSGGGQAATWVDEEIDLSPYAGQQIQLRFFSVTDESYHGAGFAVDDVSIPEIGFFDNAETDQGWQADGFIRSVNAAEVDWAVQVIAFAETGTEIHQLRPTRASADGSAEGTLVLPGYGSQIKRVIVALSPLVPVTLEPVEYRLEAVLR